MTVRLGIVMDPIDRIQFKKDSSLAMLWAAQQRGWQLVYMEPEDMYLNGGQARARSRNLTVRMDPNDWYSFESEDDIALGDLDVILMRQDPPVDREFLMATYILSAAEEQGALVVNPPAMLRDCNEKLFATQFEDLTPPLIVTCSSARLRAFYAEHKDIIMKPIDGMGGSSIFRIKENDGNLGVIIETLTEHGTRQAMAQKFVPAITQGDKRILMIEGEPVPYALARIPSAGENRGNLAAGGRGEGRELTDRDREICARVAPVIKAKGLMFVGLDVIGDYLTEINVTSPTCIRELDAAFGIDISALLMDAIAKRLQQR
ncbi:MULTISPECIES: glutathione synthase [unclassified Marinobacter]|uniref:glutathione synthase n=1 Tax=unclassified Marinobacter TaxID=83889 RepID=UPI00200E822E|nr:MULTISPECIES: glutathione synthase [unclassified Marinobacter]MCL1477720.1 glutathione synthase [Marinobacter sp.]MCL1482229.1 glutathione synthase [Marinobacter sp.]UQG55792.1 glutathione synthase [Marinobacter sp. M4C]UQG64596.1 glutathione synthase [Marinobacter sp. M2C]UQG68875.1 glutathione synthase [Marinobacter sp. M1C]